MDSNLYQALRERAAWIDLTGRGKIRVTGEDRVRFLHAMSTNHIQQLQPGTGCYAFFLNAQGKILADVNIFCMPDYLLLDTEPEMKDRVMEHLDKFIIADDVTLHDFTDATATVTVEGPETARVLNDLGGMPAQTPFSLVEWNRSQIAQWSYTGGPGYAVYVPAEEKQEFIEQLTLAGVPRADMDTADAVRIENQRPRCGVDFTEAQIPQESQQASAIHFSKGCYIGQEIVERVRSRGHVNRRLATIEIDGKELPARGTLVQFDGKDVGEITSSAWSPSRNKVVAFARLRGEALEPGSSLLVNGATGHPIRELKSC
jgi:aminomethyltransferase